LCSNCIHNIDLFFFMYVCMYVRILPFTSYYLNYRYRSCYRSRPSPAVVLHTFSLSLSLSISFCVISVVNIMKNMLLPVQYHKCTHKISITLSITIHLQSLIQYTHIHTHLFAWHNHNNKSDKKNI